MDLGQGFEFFFLQEIKGPLIRGTVGPLIAFLAPEVNFAVGLINVSAGCNLQEVFDISNHPFHPAFLIGPSGYYRR